VEVVVDDVVEDEAQDSNEPDKIKAIASINPTIIHFLTFMSIRPSLFLIDDSELCVQAIRLFSHPGGFCREKQAVENGR
jgi:hypothetical protein